MTYCEYLKTLTGEVLELHKDYHDNHYGFPIRDDNKLFERLMFEINQAGLNWLLILKKQDNLLPGAHVKECYVYKRIEELRKLK